MKSQATENGSLPRICENILPFHRAVVIRCLRLYWAIFAANIFIAESLSKEFLEYSRPGLDFISAEAKKTKTELNSISIGQCREEIAEATIQQAKHIGELVLLQNCHLGLKYMNKLFEMYKEDIADAEATKESQNAQNDASDAKDKKPGKKQKRSRQFIQIADSGSQQDHIQTSQFHFFSFHLSLQTNYQQVHGLILHVHSKSSANQNGVDSSTRSHSSTQQFKNVVSSVNSSGAFHKKSTTPTSPQKLKLSLENVHFQKSVQSDLFDWCQPRYANLTDEWVEELERSVNDAGNNIS